ncbi:MAG TPA: restriction endonuclease subunit S, partial [Candidatus Limnocylindrales bacterium]|nr:restriction endonuclease subunit S [Candidatus Limnocylindrales bacterium]
TDALIERKRRQIELLQEKRSALISHAVTKGLDSHAPMKDSGIEWLGQIPKHWRIVPLKYSLLPRGGAIKTGPFGSQLLSSDMASGDVKVYNQRNVLDRDFLSGENYVSDDKYEELKSFTVFPQDVLITTRGTIGRCALLPDNAERGILHPCLMRVQPNPLITSPEYVALLIQDSGIVLLQLQLLSNATTIEVIYSESLKSVRLPLPPASEQQAILTYVTREAERHDALISKVQDSIDVLREHRTTLISAAVTGKIDVRGEVA